MKKTSKRQKKQQDKNRKKRNEYIYGTTVGEVTSLEFTVDERTGKISFGPSMVNYYSEVSYERESGKAEKTVHRVYQDDEFLSFDSDQEIFDKHDRIIAIDTNQKEYNGIFISSTAALELKFSHDMNNGKFYRNVFIPSVIRLGIEKITEREGWYNILGVLFANNIINTNERIAFIVDSHLDELETINSHSIPVFSNFYLPENFKMVYASSDTGGEYLINRLIRLADKLSGQYIDAIIQNGKQWVGKTTTDKRISLYLATCETTNANEASGEEEIAIQVLIRPL